MLATLLLVGLMGAGWAAAMLVWWLQALYPKVEFAMGPEHQQVEKGKRGKAYGAVALIFAPLLVSLLWWLLQGAMSALS